MNVALRGRQALQSCSFNPLHSSSSWRSRTLSRASAFTRTQSTLTGVTEDEIQKSRAYCTDLLRRFDTPSHTLTAFIPRQARDAHLALRALNIDVARVADATSNPAVAALRMQFWRDAVASAVALTPRHEPAIVLLAAACAATPLSLPWLHRVVAAREARLSNPPFPDLAALESYAEHTYATLLYLTLQSLPLASLAADHVASHIGKAQGIAAVLRGLPLLAFPPAPTATHTPAAAGLTATTSHPAVTLPLATMAAAGVREEDVLRRGAAAPGLRDAVFAVATRASDHLITARELLRDVRAGREAGHAFEHAEVHEHQGGAAAAAPAEEVERAFGVFMPAVATQMWLDRLQEADFDVFDERLRRSAGMWTLPWKAYWAFTRRKL